MSVVQGDSEHLAPTPTAPQSPPQVDQTQLIHADFMTITAFPTWEVFFGFFEEYQRDTYQVFVSKTSTSVATRNQRVIKQLNTTNPGTSDHSSRLIPDEFKVYTRTFVCTHSGKPRSQSQGLRPKQSTRAMECPARINVLTQKKSDDSGWHIVVRTQVTSHNHPLDAASFVMHPRNRKVQDPMVLEAVNALRKAGVKRQKIRTYIKEKEPSKHVTRSDVNNLLARMKHDTDFITNSYASRTATTCATTQVEYRQDPATQVESMQTPATQVESTQTPATQVESVQLEAVNTVHTGNEQTFGTAVPVPFSLRTGGSGERELPVSQPTTQPTTQSTTQPTIQPTSQQDSSDVVSETNSLQLLRETTHMASGVFKLRVKRLEEQNMALFKQNNQLILQNRQYVADLGQASKKAADKDTRMMAMQRSHASLKATLRALTQEMASLKEENARLLDQSQSDGLQYGAPTETEDEQLVTEQSAKRSLPVDTSGSDGAIEFVIRPQKRSK